MPFEDFKKDEKFFKKLILVKKYQIRLKKPKFISKLFLYIKMGEVDPPLFFYNIIFINENLVSIIFSSFKFILE